MSKTPISILQEIMVQRKLGLPEYFTESCDTPGIGFQCIVKVNQLCSCGYGQTKKDAKQNSAQKALELMGLIQKTEMPVSALSKVTPRPMPNVPYLNYVGKLNEYASTNGVPYPTYNDSVIPINGVFLTHCQFLNFTTDGTGLKKKDAKQDASRKMLELLRTEDVTVTLLAEKVKGVKLEKIENLNTLNQEILARYENLSTEKDTVSKAVEIKAIPNLKEKVKTLEELKRVMESYGHKHSIETFQTKPYIMMMKIEGSTATIMGCGNTKEKALHDLYETAVQMFGHGFSL